MSDSRSYEIVGNTPVQGRGTHAGHPWYFRARYDSWQFYIAEQPDADPVGLCLRFNEVAGWVVVRPWMAGHFYHYASWMPTAKAARLIDICLRWFDEGRLEYVPANPRPVLI